MQSDMQNDRRNIVLGEENGDEMEHSTIFEVSGAFETRSFEVTRSEDENVSTTATKV